MSLATGRTKLVSSLKELRARWDRVGREWNDPVRRDIEKEFLEPLDNTVRAGAAAMEHMHELLERAKRDCQ